MVSRTTSRIAWLALFVLLVLAVAGCSNGGY
jgi:hypothetical protein